MRYLGIDWGEKRIGLATGDSETKIAIPLKVVSDLDKVIEAVKEEEADIIVIGKPLKMANIQLEVQSEFLEFLNILKRKIKIPIKIIDERLTSKAADALSSNKRVNSPSLKSPPSSRLWRAGRRAAAPRDAVAAMLILQSYLDKI